MQQTDSHMPLLEYAENASDEAFAAVVKQHIDLVYSVALRHVGDPHQAEELTQAVFIVLARKARHLRHEKALSSWLFQTTRLIARNFVRSEMRRHHREQEAYAQSALQESSGDIWSRIAPMLNAAVGALGEKDRRAIILRYYEGKNMREIGAALGASDDAAEKRVARALEKLRRFFSKQGVGSTTAILAGAISNNSVHAAPAALTTTVAAIATAKGAVVSSSTLALVKGALKFMTWTKTKTAVLLGVVAMAVTTSTVVGIKLVQDGDASSELSFTGMEQLYIIAKDGSIRNQSTIEETNLTQRTIQERSIMDLDASYTATDESGRPMRMKKRADRGYRLILNQPVPPAQGTSYTLSGRLDSRFEPNQAGDYELATTHSRGNNLDMHLVEVWRLPPGATLVSWSPEDFRISTNGDGQVELRLDKVVPPGGQTPLRLAYRLPKAAR